MSIFFYGHLPSARRMSCFAVLFQGIKKSSVISVLNRARGMSPGKHRRRSTEPWDYTAMVLQGTSTATKRSFVISLIYWILNDMSLPGHPVYLL